MRERVFLILKFMLLALLVGMGIVIWESLPVISGYAAKVVCSGVYVAGRRPAEVIRYDLASFPMNLAVCTVDDRDSSVTAKVWGLAERKAIFRTGLGATLISGLPEETLREQRMEKAVPPLLNADTMDWPMGNRMAADTPAAHSTLQAAVGLAFGEGAPATGTRAVVVVQHGRLVAERYAPGFDRNTPLAGWSMTKGIVNAFLGILVRQGKLDIHSPAPISGWADDDRRRITIAQLMHMNSGLRWWEFYAGPSDATRMLFKEANMGEYAATSSQRHTPGQVFNYSSGTANILSLIIRKTIDPREYYRWPYEQLFYRIGMYSAVLEPDAGGTFVGSSYCYATARDWARFGLLYLHDGKWKDQQILPDGWVTLTTTGSPSYGALWWLNKGAAAGETADEKIAAGGSGKTRRYPQVPADCYACEGYEGQYIWVIPSLDLVVVRLAMEHGQRLNPNKFLPALIAALR